MQVLRLHGPGDIRLHEEADPVPGPGDALVRMTAVGLCGSDLHWYEDGAIGASRVSHPLVLGHELGGIIVDGPRAGQRVAVEPAQPCGACGTCLAGHGNLCLDVRFAGHGPTDGGLRTLIAWPSRLMLPVPDTIPDDEVALLEPLGIALHGIGLANVRAGMSAGVYGCGPIGQMIIRVLHAFGLGPIRATDALPHRLEAARASGADEIHLTDVRGQPEGLTGWDPVDVAFEVAGEDAALETALRSVRVGGRVVIVGIPPTDSYTFGASLAREKGLTLVLSRRMKAQHLLRAIELVDDGVVDLEGLISARYRLAQGPEAFAALASRAGLKIVVQPSA